MSERMTFEKRRGGDSYRVFDSGRAVGLIRDMKKPRAMRWTLSWIDDEYREVPVIPAFPTLTDAQEAAAWNMGRPEEMEDE